MCREGLRTLSLPRDFQANLHGRDLRFPSAIRLRCLGSRFAPGVEWRLRPVPFSRERHFLKVRASRPRRQMSCQVLCPLAANSRSSFVSAPLHLRDLVGSQFALKLESRVGEKPLECNPGFRQGPLRNEAGRLGHSRSNCGTADLSLPRQMVFEHRFAFIVFKSVFALVF